MEDNYVTTSNPLVRLNSMAGTYNNTDIRARLYGTLKPVTGLTLQGSYSYEYGTNSEEGVHPVFFDQWNFLLNTSTPGTGQNYAQASNERILRYFMDGTAKYERSFFEKNLDFSILAGSSQEYYYDSNLNTRRNDVIDPSLAVIDAATGAYSANGSATDWVMRSFFSRLNLGWKNKYLVELNIRSDGSSRFQADKRWGYFPSASVGWRVTEESFMKSTSSWLDNLKLRGSYGALGNNAVGNYASQSVYSQGNYVLDGTVAPGMAITGYANANLTWESTYITDFGMDFAVLKNRLSGTVDYFDKVTKNILINLPVSASMGNASSPVQNAAQVSNKGVELTLAWRDKIGSDFTYGAGLNMTYLKNNVDKYQGDVKTITGNDNQSQQHVLVEGQPIGAFYGFQVDRLVQTDADVKFVQSMIDNAPIDPSTGKQYTAKQVFPYGIPQKGDLLYKSKNGLVNNDARVALGGTTPAFTYGGNINMGYKGFDFSMVFQGVTGAYSSFWNFYTRPMAQKGCQLTQEVVDGRYYDGRTTPATYPRLTTADDKMNSYTSDFWVQNRSYFKIRNIQLGYTLPKSLTNKLKIEKIRVYSSLENYITFTNYLSFDPEQSGLTYPAMRQATFGIDVSF